MEWEEHGELDAEAVKRRPDNISYLLSKCIVPAAAAKDANAGCGDIAQYSLSSP